MARAGIFIGVDRTGTLDTLKEILAEEGATVPNNAEIAIIETADEVQRDRPAFRERRGRQARISELWSGETCHPR